MFSSQLFLDFGEEGKNTLPTGIEPGFLVHNVYYIIYTVIDRPRKTPKMGVWSSGMIQSLGFDASHTRFKKKLFEVWGSIR